jgi:hypothetical protein
MQFILYFINIIFIPLLCLMLALNLSLSKNNKHDKYPLKYEAIKGGKRGKKCFVGENGGKWKGVVRGENEAMLKLYKKDNFIKGKKPIFITPALGKKKPKRPS